MDWVWVSKLLLIKFDKNSNLNVKNSLLNFTIKTINIKTLNMSQKSKEKVSYTNLLDILKRKGFKPSPFLTFKIFYVRNKLLHFDCCVRQQLS